MIRTTIEKRGDDFVVEIPTEEMERLGLREGDEVVFYPVKQSGRTTLRPEVQEALDQSWERNEAGYRYLADR